MYLVFAKILRLICARTWCHKQSDSNEPKEIAKVNIRAFNYFVGLHHNDFNKNVFQKEEYKLCELSQDTDE